MEEISSHILDIVMTVISSALFGLIGFVWKISHKVSTQEKEIQGLKSIINADKVQTKHDLDYLMNKLDAHNDKMYSIVRNRKD